MTDHEHRWARIWEEWGPELIRCLDCGEVGHWIPDPDGRRLGDLPLVMRREATP